MLVFRQDVNAATVEKDSLGMFQVPSYEGDARQLTPDLSSPVTIV
jgi:hypothetical protein